MSFRGRATSLLLVAVLSIPGSAAAQGAPAGRSASGQTVRVTGVIRDEVNGITLPGVPVELVGTTQVVYTDVDGRYILQVPPGSHQIKVALDGYEPKTIALTAGTGRTMTADVGLRLAKFATEITVTAQAVDVETSSAEAQLTERKQAQVITDNLGAQEMKQNGDGDAAAAMQRVTGLSVVDDFVYVRGLGERYSNTTLNGAVIPTTEPDRKVVPLDLFPSGLIDSVQVAKSYSPDRSAEFAGGLVQIEPLKLPIGATLDFSYEVGFNSLTTGENVLGGLGGGRDWVGFDDGTRALPAAVPTDRIVRRGGIFTPDVGFLLSSGELERIGESFSNNWSPRSRTGKPRQSFSTTLGNRFGRLGLVGSYSQSYKEQYTTEDQIYYRLGDAGLSEFSDYDFKVASRRATIGSVANVSFQMTPTHRLSVANFFTHTGKDEARTFEGFNSDIATDIRNARLFWVEEGLRSHTVSGDHFVRGLSNSSIEWRVGYAKADRDEPDLRETLYERNGDVFVLADESQSGFRMFNTLDDRSIDVAANWSTYGTQWSQLPVQVKFGGQYVDRTRDFSSRRFRFRPIGSTNLTRSPEELFTAENIGPVWEIREETRATDTYDASQTVGSFYGMTDLSLSGRARIVGGARIERFNQEVNTFDLFDLDGTVITAKLENTDVFPAANFIYALRSDQNLRLSFSQTTNRPEFRELAPFEFTDIVGGRAVVGNPNLKRALIQNVDVRWELFPGGADVLAASVFYKHFADPIERIVEPTAQLRTSFTNAEAARNVGIELEGRRRFADLVTIGANYAYVDSSITLAPAAAQVQTSLERPLAGQSKNLFNAMFEVARGPVAGRILYNFFGERISDVGSLGLPDIVEESRGSLDFVLSARVRRLNVRFSAENLTDEEYDFTQGGLLQRRYKLGRTVLFNFGFSAF